MLKANCISLCTLDLYYFEEYGLIVNYIYLA